METSRILVWSRVVHGKKTARVPRARNVSVIFLLTISILSVTASAQVAKAINPDKPSEVTGKAVDRELDEKAVDTKSKINPPNPDEPAKPQSDQTSLEASGPAQQQAAPAKGDKRGEWLFAPIPIASPAIGSGLAWAVAYIFPFTKGDTVSPPSTVGIGGVFTNNGSKAIALGMKLYLKEDKYRVTAAVGHASMNVDIYGVGKVAGDSEIFLPFNGKGTGFMTEVLFRLTKGVYIGPRVQYRNLALSLNREEANIPDPDNPPPAVKPILDSLRDSLFRQKTVALGPRVQWDTRDNTLYPTRGLFLDIGADFFGTGIGSKFTYQYYKVAFNKYATVGKRQVLGFRAMGCAAAGSRVPFYDLCLFGTTNDLRGYAAGRYQDRRMFATQGEYRYFLPGEGILGRFGVVGFGGFGGVGGKFSDIGFSDLLPAGGGGIRFRLTKKNPINFRIDYGIGKVGNTLSIGVGEAF